MRRKNLILSKNLKEKESRRGSYPKESIDIQAPDRELPQLAIDLLPNLILIRSRLAMLTAPDLIPLIKNLQKDYIVQKLVHDRQNPHTEAKKLRP